jgi:hypothetical protein
MLFDNGDVALPKKTDIIWKEERERGKESKGGRGSGRDREGGEREGRNLKNRASSCIDKKDIDRDRVGVC